METARERLVDQNHFYLMARVSRTNITKLAENYWKIVFGDSAISTLDRSRGMVLVHIDMNLEAEITIRDMILDIINLKEESDRIKAS